MCPASMISFHDRTSPNSTTAAPNDIAPSSPGHRVGRDLKAPSRQLSPSSYSQSSYSQWGKRTLDVSVALFILIFALPWIVLVLGVVSLDGGKPIYSHPRIGKGGRKFNCLKVRTMVRDSDKRLQKLLDEDPESAAEWARDFKLRNDPRITGIGKFLRKSSLDELPQIWNVLRGDMSLVGPRPVTEEEILLYGDSADAYSSVRPGITGLWQVSGRNSVSYEERVELDRQYVSTVSLTEDVRILLRTIPAVLHVTGC